MDIDKIIKMINEINGDNNIMQKEDVLSNQPYFYNKMFHSIFTTKEINVLTETLINSPTKNMILRSNYVHKMLNGL